MGLKKKYRGIFKTFFNCYRIAILLLAALIIDVSLNLILYDQYRHEQEMSVTRQISTKRARLEELLNVNLSLVYGMAAAISSRSGITSHDFNILGKIFLRQSGSLKNIAAAPDFIIQYVYPLKGNEQVIGLNYRNVPGQWDKALAARESGKMAVAGPINLVQGGRGLIARVPVFSTENGEFWGLVSAVMDLEELMKLSGINSIQDELKIAIRGKDSLGEKGDVFWGDPLLFDPASQALLMRVSLPSGSWQIAAVPKKGWPRHSPYHWLIHFAVILLTIAIAYSLIIQKRHRLAQQESMNQLKAMSHASHDAMIMIDSDDTILFCNPSTVSMFGYGEDELLGKKFHDLIVQPHDRIKAKEGLRHFALTGEGPVINGIMEMEAVRKSGEVFPVERSVASFKYHGKWCAVGSMRDITQRKEVEQQLTLMATTDALTGILNRRSLMEKAEGELKKAIRYHKALSLIMFDIDYFKKINDTYGHAAGDCVLKFVASVLMSQFRDVDICGRIGGEEFMIVLPETKLSQAVIVAERVRLHFMKTVMQCEEHLINITVSMGVARLDVHDFDIDQIMKKADEALYKAKGSGRNKVVGDGE